MLLNLFSDLHNETGAPISILFIYVLTADLAIVNIHSHLWGAVLFIFFLFTLYGRLDKYPSVALYDLLNFAIFLVSAVVCLTFSASYHTMTCHSQGVGLSRLSMSATEFTLHRCMTGAIPSTMQGL